MTTDLAWRLRAEAALRESELRFHLLADSIPQLAWMANSDGWIFWYNRRWYDYTGTTLEEMQGWGWRKVHHPDHVARVVERIKRSWETGEPWEDTFPLRGRDGQWRWFLSRALPLRDDNNQVVRWFGTNTDVTEMREAEERQRLLVNELNHRVKNTLATVQSIARQSMRNAESMAEFEDKFTARLLALSNAHNLLAREIWQGAPLADVMHEVLDPFRTQGGPERITLSGPLVTLKPAAAVIIGMVFHELATNAAKYGALTKDAGRVTITWKTGRSDNEGPIVDIVWQETGGPPVAPPRRRGFGSRLSGQGFAQETGATVDVDYEPAGVVCRIRMPLSERIVVSSL